MICQHRYGSNWKLPFTRCQYACTQCTVHQFILLMEFLCTFMKNNSKQLWTTKTRMKKEWFSTDWKETKMKKNNNNNNKWFDAFASIMDHEPSSRRQEKQSWEEKTNATNCSNECNVLGFVRLFIRLHTHFCYEFWYGQTCTKHGSIQPTATT